MNPAEKFSELKVSALRFERPGFELRADFRIGRGERVALSGPSGSGKSTLLRLVAGLEELAPGAGQIFLGSRELTRLRPHERGIGYVFQDQALFPSMSLLENVAFGLRMKGVARAEREREALQWLERVGLSSRAASNVGELSGGEAQRVAFVRALASRPEVILLDEPFSALDRELRDKLSRELVALHREWPAPLLLVSHDEADIASVATRKLALRVDGPLRRVEENPSSA